MLRLALCFAGASLLAQAQLPTAEAVLSRYVEATGGAEAYQSVKTQSARGSLEFKAMGLKASIRTFAALPNNALTVMELPGMGEIRSGVRDGIAWELSPMQGPRLLEGMEKENSMRMTRLDAPLRWKELYKEVKVDGEEQIDGRRCYRVLATPVTGGQPETSWYDAESGLLLRTRIVLVSPMGEMPLETSMADYRQAGKFRVPFKLTQKVGPQEIETTMEEIQWNVELPANQFDVPADIDALIKKQKQ
jgi:hypothetical protein